MKISSACDTESNVHCSGKNLTTGKNKDSGLHLDNELSGTREFCFSLGARMVCHAHNHHLLRSINSSVSPNTGGADVTQGRAEFHREAPLTGRSM